MEEQVDDTSTGQVEEPTTEASTASGAGNQGAPDATVSDGQAPDSATSDQADSADKVEFTKDNEGKEYVPKEVFEKRLASLTSKRKQAEELLEAIKTNPDVRKQFLGESDKVEGKEEDDGADEDTKQSEALAEPEYKPEEMLKPINDWLNQLSQSPEHQAFYRNQMQALLKTIDMSVTPFVMRTIKAEIAKAVTPISRSIGEMSIKDFSKSNPDFSRYQDKVLKLMKSKGLGFEDAFQLARYPDMVKELSKKPQQNGPGKPLPKKQAPPIAGRQNSQQSRLTTDKMSLRDAIREAAKETGF